MNDLDGKTDLVTGAAGLIGSNLVKRLAMNKNINLVVLARHPYDTKGQKNISTVIASLDKLTGDTWHQAGIPNIDIVFHFAAYTPKSWDDANNMNEIHRDNITGTQALLESLFAAAKRIIFASTKDVYAISSDSDLIDDESCPINPAALYGASKYYGEHLVRAYAKK
jgi:nucleoside-diphosphate-sugar epimerase